MRRNFFVVQSTLNASTQAPQVGTYGKAPKSTLYLALDAVNNVETFFQQRPELR